MSVVRFARNVVNETFLAIFKQYELRPHKKQILNNYPPRAKTFTIFSAHNSRKATLLNDQC